jgi:hypothetical protein
LKEDADGSTLVLTLVAITVSKVVDTDDPTTTGGQELWPDPLTLMPEYIMMIMAAISILLSLRIYPFEMCSDKSRRCWDFLFGQLFRIAWWDGSVRQSDRQHYPPFRMDHYGGSLEKQLGRSIPLGPFLFPFNRNQFLHQLQLHM